jgi:hypothetical protein
MPKVKAGGKDCLTLQFPCYEELQSVLSQIESEVCKGLDALGSLGSFGDALSSVEDAIGDSWRYVGQLSDLVMDGLSSLSPEEISRKISGFASDVAAEMNGLLDRAADGLLSAASSLSGIDPSCLGADGRKSAESLASRSASKSKELKGLKISALPDVSGLVDGLPGLGDEDLEGLVGGLADSVSGPVRDAIASALSELSSGASELARGMIPEISEGQDVLSEFSGFSSGSAADPSDASGLMKRSAALSGGRKKGSPAGGCQ